MNTFTVRLSLVVAIFLASFSQSLASFDGASRAVQNGIGYQSNLLDTANPYAVSSRRMLGILLQRYELLPTGASFSNMINDRTVDERLNGQGYMQGLRNLLSEPHVADVLVAAPNYLYGYGNCASNTFRNALDFMKSLAPLKHRPTADQLMSIRHRMLFICDVSTNERAVSRLEIEKELRTIDPAEQAKPWVDYLLGAIAFYSDDLNLAEQNFEAIANSDPAWLAETARYLTVRIAKIRADEFHYMLRDDEESEQGYQAFATFEQALKTHKKLYPTSRYADAVKNLKRYALRLRDDDLGLHQEYMSEFTRLFAINGKASWDQRLKLFNEMQLFFYAGQPYSTHPLLLVKELMMRRTHIRSDVNVRALSEIETGLQAQDSLLSSYPGLKEFANLLILDEQGQDAQIIARTRDEQEFGPLWPDALGIQARALARLGQHQKSAEAWLELDKRYPAYNALTETATQYVHAKQFDRFAALADNQPPQSHAEDNQYIYSEFEMSPSAFKAWRQPFTTLLRRGFDSLASDAEVQRVLSHTGLSSNIKFVAAEPTLRRFLLNEDYAGFLQLLNSLPKVPKNDSSGQLFQYYTDMKATAHQLALDKNDPDALVNMGYFLYSKHLFWVCNSEDVTLWETQIGGCKDSNLKNKGAVPIVLFERALHQYTQSGVRQAGEAKLLRIMILCFKSYANTNRCARQKADNYPKEFRQSLFMRLHRRFPQKAKRTPHWY